MVQYVADLCLDVNEGRQLLDDEALCSLSEIVLPKVTQVDEDIGELTTSIADDLQRYKVTMRSCEQVTIIVITTSHGEIYALK